MNDEVPEVPPRGAGRGGRSQAAAGATIGDVAAAAHVSRATVSRVMNGRKVDPVLAERVRKVAQELDYRPSALARSLSLGRTQAVGVVVPDLTNPMFQEVLRGVASGADAAGYGVVVAETAERPERETRAVRNTRSRVDALIMVAPRMTDEELAAAVATTGPVVLVNRTLPESSVPAVSVDYAEAMYQAIEHLMSLGHRSVVYLAGPQASTSNAERLAGFETAQASFGGVSFISLPCGATIADGYEAAEAVVATRATAVVAYNDLVAFGLLGRLRELDVPVPGQISVVGFDDIDLARFATPPLTTVAVPRSALGERAWSMLHEQIATSHATHGAAADTTSALALPESSTELLRTHLVLRSSTGPSPETPEEDDGRHPAEPGTTGWRSDVVGTVLTADRQRLARYVTGEPVPAEYSPRPYLHPVRALSGTRLTSAHPADRRHHHGLSLALPDVDGTTFWGGPTWVPGEGLTMLANHGRQVSRGDGGARGGGSEDAAHADRGEHPGVLRDTVDWEAPDGSRLLTEQRVVDSALLPGGAGWALRWTSDLVAERALTVAGPVRARPNAAGYGGLYWRFAPVEESVVASADGEGATACLGSRSPWLSLALRSAGSWTTVVLVQDGDDRWFVRTEPYVAAGPAVAWDGPLGLGAGQTLRVAMTALVLDGLHTPAAVAERWVPLAAEVFAVDGSADRS
ncbi:DUF6807 family protein [Luteimicrobium subarcticum]|uniref:LacI family transcriptional regulator n=1 Tax=Luteimicrobium subarcticum TaxID=620910 RepID=A0A2M8W1Q6_9MICO|nr:DUF6807 family protein [Luteimicrobium subarcticum]PJI84851.1 LacI family transcriptional regulator [Luteimicrobium subarcticum]